MKAVAAIVLVMMGLVSLAVFAEGLYRHRIWYRPKGRPRDARWLRRSHETVAYWCYTGAFGGLGLLLLSLAGWVLVRRS